MSQRSLSDKGVDQAGCWVPSLSVACTFPSSVAIKSVEPSGLNMIAIALLLPSFSKFRKALVSDDLFCIPKVPRKIKRAISTMAMHRGELRHPDSLSVRRCLSKAGPLMFQAKLLHLVRRPDATNCFQDLSDELVMILCVPDLHGPACSVFRCWS